MIVTYPLAISPPLGSAASLGEERSTLFSAFRLPVLKFFSVFHKEIRHSSFVIRHFFIPLPPQKAP